MTDAKGGAAVWLAARTPQKAAAAMRADTASAA
jgi:hypothetical protein